MKLLRFLSLALFASGGLLACSESERDPIECPAGTVRVEARCVVEGADAAVPDVGTSSTGADAGMIDAGNDGGVLPREVVLTRTAIDFGRSVVGEEHLETVDVFNNTDAAAVVRVGLISGAQGTDYSVSSSDPITPSGLMIAAGDTVTFTFAFTARAAGRRDASLAFELCDAGCPATVALTGEGLLDAIVCGPSPLAFGLVNPGSCTSETVTCTNDSSYDSTILGAIINSASTRAFTVSSTTVLPITVPPASSAPILVDFCPTDLGAVAGGLEITVAHPDPQRSVQVVALQAEGGGADLSCSPRALDFGVLGIGQTAVRRVTCENRGDRELHIQSWILRGTSPEFTPLGSSALSLAPGATAELDVLYAPIGAGLHDDALLINSDDPESPEYSIELHGETLDGAGCAISASPSALDFGGVRVGTTATAVVRFTNDGTNACGFNLLGLSQGTGSEFVLSTAPQSVQLAAGATFDVELSLTPSAATAYSATLDLSTTDPLFAVPLNVTGAGIDATYPLIVSPTSLDFGAQRFGCSNPALRTLAITNTGAAITVALALETASTVWTIDGQATANLSIPAGQTIEVQLGFAPDVAGSFVNRVRVTPLSQPALYVSLAGTAGAASRIVESFTSPGAQVIDLLLIVDDSGSMAEEQDRLATAAATLIARADASGADYRIAVTTTDPGDIGGPQAGTLRGNPAVIARSSATRIADLQNAINQGTLGSGNEMGLFTAAEAVSNAMLLAGPNAGFLRADGELVILVLTDEQDFSPAAVSSYVNQLVNRPIGVAGARMYTISGGPLGCTGPGGSADAATRYLEAVTALGGFDRSICDPDYTQSITEIADAAFDRTRAVFALGSAPAPNTIEVYVDNVLVPATTGNTVHWSVDYNAGRIIFGAGQQPPATAVVRVEYDPFCVSATCGNGSTQPSEQCDDGNPTNTDACPNTCYDAFCGDGFVRANSEQCDDNNTIPGDGCNAFCVIEGCGNGFLEPPEACDDGAMNSDTTANACRTTCELAGCGDGVTDSGEACDDANSNESDACLSTCVAASCGDGVVQSGVEECDDGNLIDADLCSNICEFTFTSFTVTTVPNRPLTPAAGGTAIFTASGDEEIHTQSIGFPFSFLGTPVTTVYAVTNGYLAFELPSGAAFNNALIPNAASPNAFVAWWWDDLDFASERMTIAGTATTQLTGSAPNRVRVFTFSNVARYGFGSDGTVINAEVRLYEGTNVIEVHYGTTTETTATPTVFSATTGWESTAGAFGAHTLSCNATCTTAQWPASTIVRYTP